MIIDKIDPFSEKNLNFIFRTREENSFKILSRESTSIEFKETFNWGSKEKYAKTIAAFANTKGGYLIFGVKNRPHEIVGLKSEAFEKIDVEEVTEFLNSTFSPEINFIPFSFIFSERKIGLIYIFESTSKPIIATRSTAQEIRDSDIFYRYAGRSERIKYPELKILLDKEREKEKKLWMKYFQKIAKVGISNIGVLDTLKGEVVGPSGSLFISEDLLDKIKFIKDGMSSNVDGEPLFQLTGDVKILNGRIIQPIKKLYQPININADELICVFLDQKEVINPLQYIKSICFETSANLPIYYFMKKGKLKINYLIREINSTTSRYPSKDRLLRRLQVDEDFVLGSIDTNSDIAKKRKIFKFKIINKQLQKDFSTEDLRCFLQAITHLTYDEIESEYLFPILKNFFKIHYENLSSNDAGIFRKALCYLDKTLFYSAHSESRS